MNSVDRLPGRHRGADGSLSAELVVLTPVLVLVAVLVVALGRVEVVRAQVAGAARAAAEAAAEAPDGAGAAETAQSSAPAALSTDGIGCRSLAVVTDTSSFAPGGWVSVRVTCQVGLADVAVAGLPGALTVSSQVTAPVDPYRAVS